MRNRTRASMILASLVTLTIGASAHAQTVRTWVSTTGSDSNPCTKALPCRTFGAAITAVSSGGEVVVSDSGGYGSVTVNKAVSIISPAGLHAAIAPTVGTALTVNVGASDVVVLRGLYLNSQGATSGINFTAGKSLHLESVVINGFANGVVFDGAGDLFVKDTLVRNSGSTGISVQGIAGLAFVSLDRVRLERNQVGLTAGADSRVTIRDSVAARNNVAFRAVGISSSAMGELNIENSMLSNNIESGLDTSSFGKVLLSNSVVSNNGTGLRNSSGSAVLRVAGTAITGNTTGLSADTGSVLASFGNNALAGNGADGTFTATIPLQ